MGSPDVLLNTLTNQVEISWDEADPVDGDIEDVIYKIEFVKKSGTLTTLESCDGADDTIRTELSCTVDMVDFNTVLDLDQGDYIRAQVSAYNEFCWSDESELNGAFDPTATVVECPGRMNMHTITRADVTQTSVKIGWDVPSANGGAAIVSYDIRYKENKLNEDWGQVVNTRNL